MKAVIEPTKKTSSIEDWVTNLRFLCIASWQIGIRHVEIKKIINKALKTAP
jgi:hypothetical protein